VIEETCTPALCHSKSLHLDRLIADLDTYKLKIAHQKIVELEERIADLEETIMRLNRRIVTANHRKDHR